MEKLETYVYAKDYSFLQEFFKLYSKVFTLPKEKSGLCTWSLEVISKSLECLT